MQIAPDAHQEYQRRHDEIWPELVLTLKEHGAHHYSIFLDNKRNLLFGYVEMNHRNAGIALHKRKCQNGGNICRILCHQTLTIAQSVMS